MLGKHLVGSSKKDITQVLQTIEKRLPADMVVWAFSGDMLTVRAGRDPSQWTDFELIFHDVSYMALPTYLDSVTIIVGGEDDHSRTGARFNALEPDHIVFVVSEDADWPEGTKTHYVVARALSCRIPAIVSPETGA